MTTDKPVKKLLDALNQKKAMGPVITRSLSESVEIAKIWNTPVVEGQVNEITKAYLIKEKGLYIGLATEIIGDLYVYMVPEHRKQGKTSIALTLTILPHLLQEKPIIRTTLSIAIMGSERNYKVAKKLADKVGFRALIENPSDCRMTMDASSLKNREYIRGVYQKLSKESMVKMNSKILYTIAILEVIQSELEYKCGFTATSEALNDQIKELNRFTVRLKYASFVE
jgi:hypothetical protein